MFIQLVKRKMGGKIMGSGWKGLRCCAVVRVARRVGGMEDSIVVILLDLFCDCGDGWVERGCTAPLSQ